jgi:REP element-mobilizing transposase RayT
MPRRPRIKLAGLPQHLVQRGINREPCFFAEEDCHSYLHWLEKAAADWRCAIHAYVLMTNHVHLLITPETETGTAKLMQAVGRRYVQYINRSYKRTGAFGKGATNPASSRQRPTCSPACATSNSTLCAPAWCKTLANTAGAVTGTTAWAKSTRASPRMRSTSR